MGRRFANGGLVLSRKPMESIIIDCHGVLIKVTVSEIAGNKTKLHFVAREEVKISRSELLAEKENEVRNDSME